MNSPIPTQLSNQDLQWLNDFVRQLNEVEKKPFLGWVEKIRRDKNKAEPRLVVVTAYRLCLIKKSGVNFSVRRHCHLSEMTRVQKIDDSEVCVTFVDGYEVGIRSAASTIQDLIIKLWTFWGFINQGRKPALSCRWIDRDQQTLIDNLAAQVPIPKLSPQEYVLNAFKSYCSFNQEEYETVLEALSSQLDRAAGEPVNLSTRKLAAEHLSYDLLNAFTHSALLQEMHLYDIKMNEEDITSLVECCKTCPNLKAIRLSNIGTHHEIGNLIKRALEANPKFKFEAYHLEFCKLSDKSFKLLQTSIHELRYLTELSLIGLGVPTTKFAKLIQLLPKHTPLRKLNFSRNELGSKGTRALTTRFAKDQDLHDLKLSGCNIDMDELLNGMKNSFLCVKSLDLTNNSISEDQGLQLSSLVARRKCLVDIAFVNCALEGLTIASICASMLKKPQCSGPVSIDLSSNNIGTETAILIASILAQSDRLEALKLNYCELGFEGLTYILQYCPYHPDLKILQFNRNVRTDEWRRGQHGITDGLVSTIRECTKLEVLCIRGDYTNGYSLNLNRFLQQCQHTSLKSLDISCNDIPQESHDFIKQIILDNSTLRELYWDENNLTSDTFVSIIHAFSQNPGLQLIEFPEHDFQVLVKNVKGDERKLEDLRRKRERFLQTRFINKHHQGFHEEPIYRKKNIIDRVVGLPASLPHQIVRKHFRRKARS